MDKVEDYESSKRLQGVRTAELQWLAVTSTFIPQTSAGEGRRWKAMHLLCNLCGHNIPPWSHCSAPQRSHVRLFAQKRFQKTQVCMLFSCERESCRFLTTLWVRVFFFFWFDLFVCLFQNACLTSRHPLLLLDLTDPGLSLSFQRWLWHVKECSPPV